MSAAAKTCGTCTLCCKLLGVAELGKPRGTWCVHARSGQGCGIYATRPQSCRSYDCLWLTEAGLSADYRPDRTKTVLLGYHDAAGRKAILAICDRATPSAWKAQPIVSLLRTAAAHGHPVYAVAGQRYWRISAESETETDAIPLPGGVDMLEAARGSAG